MPGKSAKTQDVSMTQRSQLQVTLHESVSLRSSQACSLHFSVSFPTLQMQRDSKNVIREIILATTHIPKGKITTTKYPSKTIKPLR